MQTLKLQKDLREIRQKKEEVSNRKSPHAMARYLSTNNNDYSLFQEYSLCDTDEPHSRNGAP